MTTATERAPRDRAPRAVRRVVLVEPKSPGFHIFSRFGLPRIGVVLLGTILRDAGFQVTVMVEEKRKFDWRAIRSADLVGISAITPTAVRSYELADRIRACGIPVVMGGPHVTHRADEALEHCDFVVRGEGELALPALIDAMQRGAGFGDVAGLSFLDARGRPVHVPVGPAVRDLDQFPDPDFSLIAGFTSPSLLGTKKIVPIQTSRGCPHDCSFCTVTTTFGRKMRYRSMDRVLAEMARYDFDKTHFFIYDDNFTANRRRTRELLDGIQQLSGGRARWSAQVRADVARDTELLDQMAECGCTAAYIGLESVNDETLKNTNKKQSLAEVSTYLRRFQARSIDVHGMFVFGFDTDGPDTMERTVRFAQQQDLFSVQFLILTPLPGSRLADELQAEGRVMHDNWALYDTHHVTFWPAQVTPAELQRWQLEGHRRFYSTGQAIRRLFSRKWEWAAVSLYAARLNRRWERRNGRYLASLEGLSDRLAAMRPAPQPA